MSKKNFETEAIRIQSERTQFKEHATPLYLTSGFVFDDAEEMRASFAEEKERDLYSRYSNPNTSEFIEKICKMEGAEDGFAFASGMAAIYSTFAALLSSGDHIVSARSVFGATQRQMQPRIKIKLHPMVLRTASSNSTKPVIETINASVGW